MLQLNKSVKLEAFSNDEPKLYSKETVSCIVCILCLGIIIACTDQSDQCAYDFIFFQNGFYLTLCHYYTIMLLKSIWLRPLKGVFMNLDFISKTAMFRGCSKNDVCNMTE